MERATFANIVRSRLFLLFMILTLTGFLVLHYMPHNSHLDIVVNPLRSLSLPVVANKSGHLNLYEDVLEHNLNEENNAVANEVRGSNTVLREEEKQCKKKINVSFLKVHKAGSTTVMNIFIRFAVRNNLNIVLPSKSSGFGFNYLGYGKTVSRSAIVPLPKNESQYNILCNHVVYNKKAFHSILPNDTVYVGILREPVSHFKSAAMYYKFYQYVTDHLADQVPAKQAISKFLENPSAFHGSTYFVYNRMSYDLGVPKAQFHNDTFIDDYIAELDQDYELMMIMEHFIESLILLKRTLCWSTKDILYVPLNSGSVKTEFVLSERDVENLRMWNSADFKLYDHFYNVFTRKVEALGQDFKDEVDSFKNIQTIIRLFCLSRTVRDPFVAIADTKWSKGFIVTREECNFMAEPELKTISNLIDRAWKKYNDSLSG